MASLTRASFRLDGNPPTIVCEAAYTKNGRKDEQPIPEPVAALLRSWLPTRPKGRPVFALPERTAEMIRGDLAAAAIPHESAAGTVDFHALRVAYVSALVASGASVKTCQVLARHSTPNLTIGIYAKASLHDIQGAVEGLPDLTTPRPATETARATGTEGRIKSPCPPEETDRGGFCRILT